MWKNGRTPATVSSSPSAWTARTWHRLATTLRCVSITPFGRPVVPLEYGSATRSPGSAASGSGAFACAVRSSSKAASPSTRTSSAPASRARAANGSATTASRAPALRSWKPISSAVYAGLTVVTTAPSAATAWKTTAYTGAFGAHSATTSPRPIPRSASPAASDRTWARRPAYVSVAPVAPSISAGRSPRASACSSTNAGSVTSGTSTSGNGLRKIMAATVYPGGRDRLTRGARRREGGGGGGAANRAAPAGGRVPAGAGGRVRVSLGSAGELGPHGLGAPRDRDAQVAGPRLRRGRELDAGGDAVRAAAQRCRPQGEREAPAAVGLRDRLDLVAPDEERHATDLAAADAGLDRTGRRACARAAEGGGAARRTARLRDAGDLLRRGHRGRGHDRRDRRRRRRRVRRRRRLGQRGRERVLVRDDLGVLVRALDVGDVDHRGLAGRGLHLAGVGPVVARVEDVGRGVAVDRLQGRRGLALRVGDGDVGRRERGVARVRDVERVGEQRARGGRGRAALLDVDGRVEEQRVVAVLVLHLRVLVVARVDVRDVRDRVRVDVHDVRRHVRAREVPRLARVEDVVGVAAGLADGAGDRRAVVVGDLDVVERALTGVRDVEAEVERVAQVGRRRTALDYLDARLELRVH